MVDRPDWWNGRYHGGAEAWWISNVEWAPRICQDISKASSYCIHAHMWRLKVYCDLEEAEQTHHQMMLEFGGRHARPADEADSPGTDRPDMVRRYERGAEFQHEAALATQTAKASRKNCWKMHAACRICNKIFHTRTRLLQHWHHGQPGCWIKLMWRYSPMTLEETGEAFHEKGVKKDRKAWACKRLVGRPLAEISGKGPPTPQELEERRHFGFLTQGQGGRTTTSKTPKTIQVPNVIDDTQTLERQIVEDITSWTFPGASIPRPPATSKWYYLGTTWYS